MLAKTKSSRLKENEKITFLTGQTIIKHQHPLIENNNNNNSNVNVIAYSFGPNHNHSYPHTSTHKSTTTPTHPEAHKHTHTHTLGIYNQIYMGSACYVISSFWRCLLSCSKSLFLVPCPHFSILRFLRTCECVSVCVCVCFGGVAWHAPRICCPYGC